jgi:hypothetical protein
MSKVTKRKIRKNKPSKKFRKTSKRVRKQTKRTRKFSKKYLLRGGVKLPQGSSEERQQAREAQAQAQAQAEAEAAAIENYVVNGITGTYIGELNEYRIPEGEGKFTSAASGELTSFTYVGHWENGQMSGQGTKTMYGSDGPTTFEGLFANGKMTYGTYTRGNGTKTVYHEDGSKTEVPAANV